MTLRTAAIVAGAVLALGVSGQTFAQTAPGQGAPSRAPAASEAPATPVPGQIVTQDPNMVLASRDFIGQTVYAPDKAKIGSISDLVLSKDGKAVQGFVIGIGGFLGIGERNVALQMEKLKVSNNPDGSVLLTMDMSKDELSKAPVFKTMRDQEAEKKRNEMPTQRPASPGGGATRP
jgi:sporulation protein YlmC with PRC-barrel domain